MPELPDITIYLEALDQRVVGHELSDLQVFSPFVLRTAAPAAAWFEGRRVSSLRRIGKRIAFEFDHGGWLVMHLMIAGRLQWRNKPVAARTRNALVVFRFSDNYLVFTEAGSKKRASLHLFENETDMLALDPQGLEVLACSEQAFIERLRWRNHTLKRALTDPRLFSGIGNAYSDEILHAARLSPAQLTQKLDDESATRLYLTSRSILQQWTATLRAERGDTWPAKITAFRDGMAVHGRYGQPCPVCATQVQRIRYAANELNYCPRCQTGGRLLADRSLSRLLKKDWPKTIDELENPRSKLAPGNG